MKKLSAIIIVLMATANLFADWTWGSQVAVSNLPLDQTGATSSTMQITTLPFVSKDSIGTEVVAYGYKSSGVGKFVYKYKVANSEQFSQVNYVFQTTSNPLGLINTNGNMKAFFYKDYNSQRKLQILDWNPLTKIFENETSIGGKVSYLTQVDYVSFQNNSYIVWDANWSTSQVNDSKVVCKKMNNLNDSTIISDNGRNPRFFVLDGELNVAYVEAEALKIRTLNTDLTWSTPVVLKQGVTNFSLSSCSDQLNIHVVYVFGGENSARNGRISKNNSNYVWNNLSLVISSDNYPTYKLLKVGEKLNLIISYYEVLKHYELSNDGLQSTEIGTFGNTPNFFLQLSVFSDNNNIHAVYMVGDITLSTTSFAYNVYYSEGTNPSSIIESNMIQKQVVLSQNYPNPFNNSTSICFDLPKDGQVELSVYNANGEQIKQLVNTELSSGAHSVTFDASNLNSGIYFYKLNTPENSTTKKMILVK